MTELKEKFPKALWPIILNCHRRLGKSHLGALFGSQRSLARPGRRIRYGAATKDQVEEIVTDPMERITAALPPELQPSRRGNTWTFRNPRWGNPKLKSVFSVHALEHMSGNRQRGLGATDWIIDEARDLTSLEYLIRHVIGFHFVDALKLGFDPLLLIFSTPPESPAHPFSHVFIPEAEKNKTYMVINVDDNEDWSKEDEEFLVELCGGRETVAWQREAMCKIVGDASRLVIPEFEPMKDTIVREWTRPPYFNAWTALDTGWSDRTGVVFFYLDFDAHKIVVEDELFEQYKSTGEMADLIRPKYAALYEGQAKLTRWVADADPKELGTFGRDHGLHFQPADKHDKWQAVNMLRTGFQQGWIVIHPRCVNLVLQCRYGIKNKHKTDFERSEALGHLDTLAALIYGYRKAFTAFGDNPVPQPSEHPTQDEMLDPAEYNRRVSERKGFDRLFYTPTQQKGRTRRAPKKGIARRRGRQ